jgi:hypothetical protein
MKVLEQEFDDAKFGSIHVDKYFFPIKLVRGKVIHYIRPPTHTLPAPYLTNFANRVVMMHSGHDAFWS